MKTIELGTLYNRKDGHGDMGIVTIYLEDEFCVINFPEEYSMLEISIPTYDLANLVQEAIAQKIVLLSGSE